MDIILSGNRDLSFGPMACYMILRPPNFVLMGPWPRSSVARGMPLPTRVLLRIMNRPLGFSSTATLNAACARGSERQIASVSLPYTRAVEFQPSVTQA